MLPALFGLFALFGEIDVKRSIGAALIGAGLLGTIAAGRWIMAGPNTGAASGGAVAASSSTGKYLKLALVMAIGLGIMFAGVALQSSGR